MEDHLKSRIIDLRAALATIVRCCPAGLATATAENALSRDDGRAAMAKELSESEK